MAAVTIYSDFGAQENSLSLLPLPPFYFPWSNGNRCCDLRFLNVELEASFFILPLYPYQEALLFLLAFYHGYNLQYPRLLIFLPAIWISACDSSSLTFHMFSAYKLNKQGDSIQSCCIPFQILNIVNVSSENTHTHTHTHKHGLDASCSAYLEDGRSGFELRLSGSVVDTWPWFLN